MESQVNLEEIFPKHLGFGTLDESKTRVEESEGEKVFHAVYLAGPDDPVYTIQVKPDCCYVEEFFEERRIALTRSKTLKGAWLQKFTAFGENPRFQALVSRITQGKNVSVANPGESKRNLIAFPEGLIFHLWLPIWDRELMKGIDEADQIREPLHFRTLHQGTVITMNRDHDLIHCSMPILEFTANLIDLEAAVNFCHERGWLIMPFFQEVGLHILATADARPGVSCVYLTGGNKRIIAHSLLLNREGDHSLRQTKDYMEDVAAQKENRPPQQLSERKNRPENWEFLIGGKSFGKIVGFDREKGGILCVTCYREKYGNVVYLGETEQIFDEKQEKDFRRGTSAFLVDNDEVILCEECWRVILRIPRFLPPPIPRGN